MYLIHSIITDLHKSPKLAEIRQSLIKPINIIVKWVQVFLKWGCTVHYNYCIYYNQKTKQYLLRYSVLCLHTELLDQFLVFVQFLQVVHASVLITKLLSLINVSFISDNAQLHLRSRSVFEPTGDHQYHNHCQRSIDILCLQYTLFGLDWLVQVNTFSTTTITSHKLHHYSLKHIHKEPTMFSCLRSCGLWALPKKAYKLICII